MERVITVKFPRLIGLSGLASAGKGTVAKYLVNNHGFYELSFGGALKDISSQMFGLPRELLEGSSRISRKWREEKMDRLNGRSPREILQQVGISMREIDPEVWVNVCEAEASRHLDCGRSVVVSDVRYPNEMDMIHIMEGEVWRVEQAESRQPLWYRRLLEHGLIDYRNIEEQHLQQILGEPVHSSEYTLSTPSAQSSMDAMLYNTDTLEFLYNQIEEHLHAQQCD